MCKYFLYLFVQRMDLFKIKFIKCATYSSWKTGVFRSVENESEILDSKNR